MKWRADNELTSVRKAQEVGVIQLLVHATFPPQPSKCTKNSVNPCCNHVLKYAYMYVNGSVYV